jgi:Yip1 domain
MSTTPETVVPGQSERSSGLATYLKVLYAPGEAFATLARVPTWGWAAVIGIVLTVVATIILAPATTHYAHVAQEHQFAQMPADQAAAARAAVAKFPDWLYPVFGTVAAMIFVWIFWLIGAAVFAVGAALSGGEAKFSGAWVSALNLYIIGAVGAIINSIIVFLRGAASVNNSTDLYALPSLALVVHGSPKLTMFLYGFNVVYIWYYVAAVIALEAVMKMSRTASIVTVLVLAFLSAGLAALFAK